LEEGIVGFAKRLNASDAWNQALCWKNLGFFFLQKNDIFYLFKGL